MPPNKDDDPTKSSGGAPAGGEVDPSTSEDPTTEDPKPDKETLESIASRMVQSSMDQSIAHVEQGQFGKLNPKVTQLLTTYDRMTRPAPDSPGGEEADPYADLLPSAKPDRSDPKKSPRRERAPGGAGRTHWQDQDPGQS
ncbi:hypothetical protein LCGC14_1899150 [marine sediment metagenome]|uniref:Uncharacterized protein n=1 Tax=marine sediment metagenome TaxID=412755 RepID=A0A0F9IV74_9ZZZZ